MLKRLLESCSILTRLNSKTCLSFPLWGINRAWIMTDTKNDKHKDYCRYATRCLAILPTLADPGARAAQLEMAAKWLKLVDEIIKPSKVIQLSRAVRGRLSWRPLYLYSMCFHKNSAAYDTSIRRLLSK
jgi:hypothetical protein